MGTRTKIVVCTEPQNLWKKRENALQVTAPDSILKLRRGMCQQSSLTKLEYSKKPRRTSSRKKEGLVLSEPHITTSTTNTNTEWTTAQKGKDILARQEARRFRKQGFKKERGLQWLPAICVICDLWFAYEVQLDPSCLDHPLKIDVYPGCFLGLGTRKHLTKNGVH